MTPRLRILLIGLGISVVIMVFDLVNQSKSKGSKKPRKVNTRSSSKVVASSTTENQSVSKTTVANPRSRRRSSRTSQLVGWQRNPFNSVSFSDETNVESGAINKEKQQDIEKSILLKNLERYNVEIVAEFNNEKVVLIDNRRFRQGEFLNNEILIETIDNDQITFRNGNTRVTRIVGN